MKKAGIAATTVAAVLVVTGVAGPKFTGDIATHQIDKAVAAINAQGMLHAAYTPRSGGWFGQQGDLVLTLHASRNEPQGPAAGHSLTAHLDIAYGPWPFAAIGHGGGFGLLPVGAVINADIDGVKQALASANSSVTLRDVVSLSGNNHLHLGLEPGHYRAADGSELRWDESRIDMVQSGAHWGGEWRSSELDATGLGKAQGNLKFSPLHLHFTDLEQRDGLTAGRIKLEWNGMQGDLPRRNSNELVHLSVGAVTLDSRTRFDRNVPVGEASMSLASVDIGARNMPGMLTLQGLRVDSTSKNAGDDYVDSTLRWNLARASVAGKPFAPVRMELALDHEYVPAVRALAQAARQLRQRQAMAGFSPGTTDPNALAALMPAIQDLLAHGLDLRLSQFEVGLPQGTLNADGDMHFALQAGDKADPQTLMRALVGKLELHVPAALAADFVGARMARQGVPAAQRQAEAQQALDKLVAAGTLQRQGTDYLMRFTSQAGVVQLNGRTIRQF